MPSECGGSSNHPAYDPEALCKQMGNPRKLLVGDINYVVLGDGDEMEVVSEDVSGRCLFHPADSAYFPEGVKRMVKALKDQASKKG